MTQPTLLIMAAGMGSRYGGLKQIDPIGPRGEIVLDFSIYDALRAGFGKVVFVIRKDIEDAFKKAVGSKYENRVAVEYVFQDLEDLPNGYTLPEGRSKPWGTSHAILAAREVVREPFAALNADDFYGANSFQVLGDFLRRAEDRNGRGDYAMVGFDLSNTLSPFGSVARGICEADTDANLTSVVELTKLEEKDGIVVNTEEDGSLTPIRADAPVSMNIWGFTPSYMEKAWREFELFLRRSGSELKSEFYIPSVVDRLIKNGEATCKILPTASRWFGVTYQEDKPYVMEQMKKLADQGDYPSPLWK